jgi:hypothetical protein
VGLDWKPFRWQPEPVRFSTPALGLLFVLLLATSGCSLDPRLTTDKEMQDYFAAHHDDFQALADAVLNDKDAKSIIKFESSSADPFRAQMNRVSVRFVFKGSGVGGQSIGMTNKEWGDRAKKLVLGFMWMSTPPPLDMTVPNINSFMESGGYGEVHHSLIRYRLLSGHWYIVVMRS